MARVVASFLRGLLVAKEVAKLTLVEKFVLGECLSVHVII